MSTRPIILGKLKNVTSAGDDQWSARCPAHDDATNSLSVGVGKDGRTLLHCFAGCDTDAIRSAVGAEWSDLFDAGGDNKTSAPASTSSQLKQGNGQPERKKNERRKPKGKKAYASATKAAQTLDWAMQKNEDGERVASWEYRDAVRNPVAAVIRYNLPTPPDEKQLKTFRPISKHADGWRLCDPPGKWPLYRLADLSGANHVVVVEGEKTCDAAWSVGLTATTSAHGAKSPGKTDWAPLAGKQVVIVPDAGDAGLQYAAAVAGILSRLEPRPAVKITELPGLREGDDLVEWLERGGTREKLDELVDATPEWEPPAASGNTSTAGTANEPQQWPTLEPGTVVRPKDKNNFGDVVADHGGSADVHFRNPSTGAEATKNFHKSDLRWPDGRALTAEHQPVITPRILTIGELRAQHPELRKPAIEGLLREGEIANLIAAPKTHKSWLAADLSLAVATGRRWLDTFCTAQGKVLILDAELHHETVAHRIPIVAKAKGLTSAEYENPIHVDCLRGRLPSILEMDDYFGAIEPGRYKIIVFDALYRFLAGINENDNSAFAQVYNALDRYAAKTGAAILLVHHSSKGDQSGKSVTDMGSGAGSQSRAADTHLVLRPHQEDDIAVLDFVVRSFQPAEAMALRWEFPLWRKDDAADPKALRRPGENKKLAEDNQISEEICELLQAKGALTKRTVRNTMGLGDTRLNRLVYKLVRGGRVRTEEQKRGQKVTTYISLVADSQPRQFQGGQSAQDEIF